MSGMPTSSPPAPLLAPSGVSLHLPEGRPPSLLTTSLEARVSPLFSQSIPHPPGYSWMSVHPQPRSVPPRGSGSPLARESP